ncbi:predicted protein [Sclerotinia sclerotiorum 1980 UF-70]|uniref:Uncharacterized protein n=1 Tax=Sclerotinia sclerotiorum (strain ATCC 18683 / 1980 / Ss-1) TaxID=665079 RepID=A7FA46_SCLS1|nr:predicted protein [Sclerotinia sclerotiorum 1980 UF-70]EDO00607.1 predicted protein [Sclerotinia sclerotiorum 1980 UF-70]
MCAARQYAGDGDASNRIDDGSFDFLNDCCRIGDEWYVVGNADRWYVGAEGRKKFGGWVNGGVSPNGLYFVGDILAVISLERVWDSGLGIIC